MIDDNTRLIRLRQQEPRERDEPSAAASAPRGTLRFLGQVHDGGSMPSRTGTYFLVNPASLGGVESEGVTATPRVDTSRSIPVLVIGAAPPRVGDLLLAVAVVGRWVAESGRPALGSLVCSPCTIPKKTLVLSWSNPLLGDGSTSLVFSEPDQWISTCTNDLVYSLACKGGSIVFSVSYFVSGTCPDGQPQSCLSSSQGTRSLIPGGFSCTPFFLTYAVNLQDCPVLSASGYSSFIVTE